MPPSALKTLIHPTLSRLSSLLPSSPVLVFVGGTSGIGLSTLRALVSHNTSSNPRVYIVGRSSTAATEITKEFQFLNPGSTVTFLQSDVSLLKNVDAVCDTIKQKEDRVNVLFMTCGFFTVKGGRQDTSEGIDRKMALHYYARARFIQNLAPLLHAASTPSPSRNSPNSPDPNAPRLSRVISILDSKLGLTASPNFSDLSLSQPDAYTLRAAATHATALNTWALEHWAAVLPGTSFIHGFPGTVRTGVGRELGAVGNAGYKILAMVLRPLFVDLGVSGEGWGFACVSGRYPPKDAGAVSEGVGNKDVEVAIGSDGVQGSGAYAVDWDGVHVFGEKEKFAGAEKLRREGAAEKVWRHTEEVFAKVLGERQ